MGSKSSSNTSTTSNVTNNTETTAFNLAEGGTAIDGDGNTVVNQSMDADVAKAALFAVEGLGEGAFNLTESLGTSAFLASENMTESGFDLSRDVTQSGFDFGGQVLSEGANLLGSLAQMQERGLDNALDVAKSFGTNDGAEVAGNAVKYMALAAAALAVAMVLRGKK